MVHAKETQMKSVRHPMLCVTQQLSSANVLQVSTSVGTNALIVSAHLCEILRFVKFLCKGNIYLTSAGNGSIQMNLLLK